MDWNSACRDFKYLQINVIQILNQLKPGETIEYQQAYIGDKQQLFSRLIFHRLTEAQLKTRLKKIVEKETLKQQTYSEKSKLAAGLNVYVTNAP